jgi:hypothetical protein
MDTLATIAGQRAVMATIADLIVAAATGKRLRVAVGCTHPDQTGFVEHLTRALHARGRPGHCLAPKPDPITTDGYPPAGGPAVAVINSGAAGPDEYDLCRINIQLHTPTPVTVSVASADGEPDGTTSVRSAATRPPWAATSRTSSSPTSIRAARPCATSGRPSCRAPTVPNRAGSPSDRSVRPP